jgi:chaperonin GroES
MASMTGLSRLPYVPIVPNGLRYWVMPDKKEATTIQIGETVLSGTADEKDPPLEGRVVAVGDAKKPGDGLAQLRAIDACKYQRGDKVVYGAYAGNKHVLEGAEYTILHEDDILGLVIETPFDVRDNTDLSK